MKYLFWLAEAQQQLEARIERRDDPATELVIAVVSHICKASYLDAFMPLDARRMAEDTGIPVHFIEQTVDDLVALGLMRERVAVAGARILEPAAALRPKCRLLGWFDPMERGTWR